MTSWIVDLPSVQCQQVIMTAASVQQADGLLTGVLVLPVLRDGVQSILIWLIHMYWTLQAVNRYCKLWLA